MNIYFVDGLLLVYPEFRRYVKVDARDGISANMKDLRYYKLYCSNPENTNVAVVTNCLEALSTEFGWDDTLHHYSIYLFRNNKWVNIQKMTKRNLTISTNLKKLYLSGEFDNIVPT